MNYFLKFARWSVVLSGISIVGCNSTQTIQPGTGSLIGQPISAAVALFGPPDSETQQSGQTVYTWREDREYSRTQFSGSNSVYGNNFCVLQIYADDNDLIQTWDFDRSGAASGPSCSRFTTQLR